MKIISEFKAFAMRWNVIDLAVWVIIWGAFWKIVSSLVSDLITPFIWILIWWVNLSMMSYSIKNMNWWIVSINYGKFLQTLFDFMIIALSIFVIIKLINKAQDTIIKKEKKEEIIEMQKKSDDLLVLEEIRDLLKTQKTVKKEAK